LPFAVLLLLLLTTRAKGALRTSSPVLFWYLRISCKARVPGLYLCFFSASGCRTATHAKQAGGFGGAKMSNAKIAGATAWQLLL
jgi:hypothetical protein